MTEGFDFTHDDGSDGNLGLWLRAANIGAGVTITVVVGGTWISGTTVSRSDWMDQQREIAAKVLPVLESTFATVYEMQTNEVDDDDPVPPKFLRLKDVRSNFGPVMQGDPAPMLAVRLDRIDAWMLGAAQTGP